MRRYDVDSLRVFALFLLIVYHAVITFQPWANTILFIQNEESLEWLWVIMAAINVWRIPILFLISGMAVHFAMKRRDWQALLKDRTLRIMMPYLFGLFVVAPISVYIGLQYYNMDGIYFPNSGHLWFLINIFIYIIVLLPLLFYLKDRPNNFVIRVFSSLFHRRLTLYLVAIPLMLEAGLVNPEDFPSYAETLHGFLLGFVCFIIGFIFIAINKDVFWQKVESTRWVSFIMAFSIYLVRLLIFELEAGMPNWIIAFESMCWMLAILGFGTRYLNRPSYRLAYLSKAVYPVYILHMPIQFGISYYLIPLDLPAVIKLLLMLVGIFGISFFIFEYIIRRIKWIRPLFGMKFTER